MRYILTVDHLLDFVSLAGLESVNHTGWHTSHPEAYFASLAYIFFSFFFSFSLFETWTHPSRGSPGTRQVVQASIEDLSNPSSFASYSLFLRCAEDWWSIPMNRITGPHLLSLLACLLIYQNVRIKTSRLKDYKALLYPINWQTGTTEYLLWQELVWHSWRTQHVLFLWSSGWEIGFIFFQFHWLSGQWN